MEYFVNKFRTLIMVSENKSVNLVLFGGKIDILFEGVISTYLYIVY